MANAVADKRSGLIERVGGALDRVVRAWSPERAARRQAYRNYLEVTGADGRRVTNSAYRSASRKRSNQHWVPGLRTADEELLPEKRTILGRARDVAKNHPVGAGAIEAVLANEIRDGIRPRSHVDADEAGISPETTRAIEKQINRMFKRWSKWADVQGRMSFYGVQELIDRTLLVDGESFVIARDKPRTQSPVGFCVDVIEPMRVSDPRAGVTARDGRTPEIVDGIELDADGEAVACWVEKAVRGTRGKGRGEWHRVPYFAADGRRLVSHIYKQMRPGQTRGVPFFSPVIDYFQQLDDYLEAELTAARAAACFSLFIKTGEGANAFDQAVVNADGEVDDDGERLETLQPGTVEYLNEGEEPVPYMPNRPGSGFEPFIDRVVGFIGAGLGLSPQIVMSDFKGMNFSQMRGAIVQAGYLFRGRQSFLIEQGLEWIWNELVWELAESEAVVIPGFWKTPEAYCGVRWTVPGREAIDPTKEAQADAIRLKNKTTTVTQVLAREGRGLEEHVAESKEEQDEFAAAGVPLPLPDGKSDPGEITKEGTDDDPDEAGRKEMQTANL